MINSSEIDESKEKEQIENELLSNIGVGFDVKSFLFARFIKSEKLNKIDFSKTNTELKDNLFNMKFSYEKKIFIQGLEDYIFYFNKETKLH